MRFYSQLGQDRWVLGDHGPEPGFFVEVGACDGVLFSNTLALEEAGWRGICAEPNPAFYRALVARRRCATSPRCVFRASGQRLSFNPCPAVPELGGLVDCFGADWATAIRQGSAVRLEVETISLLDLLRAFEAPATIDYVSLDTEGSELEILRGFDFSAYDVRRWSIEHNHTPARRAIHSLLTVHGYRRVTHRELSAAHGAEVHPGETSWQRPDFDDWYVRR